MKNSKILNQEKTNLKERNKMKNLKKLVSSVLVVTLLAGSAASLSCSAGWFSNLFSRSNSSSTSGQETSEQSTQGETQETLDTSSAESKTTESAPELKINLVNNPPKKEPFLGERILNLNPYLKREIDELYNPPCNEDPVYNCDNALTALKGLEKAMLGSRMYSDTQKQQIKEDIELLRQVVNFKKAKLKGSLTDKMKKEFREIENKFKNALSSLISLAAKIGIIALVVGICYGVGSLIGFENITTFLLNVTGWTIKTLLSCLCTVLKGIGLGSWAVAKSICSGCWNYFFSSTALVPLS